MKSKIQLYAIIGVQEYWLAYPVIRKAERYKNTDGTMQLTDMIVEEVKVISYF